MSFAESGIDSLGRNDKNINCLFRRRVASLDDVLANAPSLSRHNRGFRSSVALDEGRTRE
jgi:hypothetical protein